MSDRRRVLAGVVIAALFITGYVLRGHVLPGLVGGALAGVLTFLVLREYESQRRRRR